MKNPTSTTEAHISPTKQYVTLKSSTAAKLGKYADGFIGYTVSCDPGRTALFISITDNSSGGYFSREPVALDRIQELRTQLDQSKFVSKALKAVFNGKSSNNAGFLAAILHTEGLLARAVDDESKHVVVSDWAKWKSELLALEGSRQVDTSVLQSTDAPDSLANNKAVAAKPQKPVNPPK